MRVAKLASWVTAGVVWLAGAAVIWPGDANAAAGEARDTPIVAAGKLDNATCLTCHDGKQKPAIEVEGPDGEARPLRPIESELLTKSVHGDMQCLDCHKEIKDSKENHEKTSADKPSCTSCHEAEWEKIEKAGLTEEKARMGLVVENIEAYKKSFHARPNADDETRPNASCDNCHDTHTFDVAPRGTTKRTNWHLTVPKVCSQSCHEEQLDSYAESVHGKEVLDEGNPKGAVCTDCHTAHDIINTSSQPFKVDVTKVCGDCHQENFKTYGFTYHGQVNRLGYAYTAKCYDCHGSHEILKVDDPDSKVHPDNRLKTCKECHNGKKDLKMATAGFVSFSPHANTHDFERYPQMWVAGKFMLALLIAVFTFFWAHSGMWWYREYKERKGRLPRSHVDLAALHKAEGKQVKRFGAAWRAAHLLFAIATMLLVLTGTSVLFSESAWAPAVVEALGGTKMASIIHRVSATVFLLIFFGHLVYMSVHLWRRRKTFSWFGPDSLVPRWQDLKDIIAMFKWFLGKGPRPVFDRWTYWEKFDYWAVFWGVAVIGGSGLMLAFPEVTAQFLPGWVFNVATLVHGEEAFLAAVFLFTVHFFNNHFRPDKMPPPDIVMFTGRVDLEEFRHEHAAQYQRLVASGELEKYLVEAPSTPMTLGSKLLGIVLIVAGLTLLVLVVSGFLVGGSVSH